jgi:group II intron reverse transcriptase/maturase
MHGYSTRENREIPVVSVAGDGAGADRSAKAHGHTADMHAAGKSDGRIVPTKDSNNSVQAALAESLEGRRPTTENSAPAHLVPDAGPDMGESRGLRGVREAAQRDKRMRFTALLHHVSVDRLRTSFAALKRDAAPGIDGVTWHAYERECEARLIALHDRVHRGSYRAQPSKRAYIPKADGRQRPLGIAALEDKIVQHAVGVVLAQVYEADFVGFSYGFRPGRSQHDALDALVVGIEQRRVNWVLDADIRGFFDTIDHGWLLKFLEHRIADPRVLRLIRKWLQAGVSEDGQWSRTTVGTPQGAVISPLLANIYLHYVFDLWIQRWRERHAHGDVIVVRYADDIVMGFEHRHEAETCLAAWHARLAEFGLALHPDKTRLLEFGRHAIEQRKRRGAGKPETFDFLGFTHFCGKARRSGRFRVQRKSSRKRMRLKLRAIRAALQRRMHQPVPVVGQWLRRVVSGYFAYHAVPLNGPSLTSFRKAIIRMWARALRRRSQRGRVRPGWVTALVRVWIPPVRILHPYPSVRFAATHPR